MKTHRSLAERWLWLGVTALAAAGIYSLIPVIGRTPQLKGLGVMQQLFDVALVVHVNLSVYIWFLAMLGMGLSLMMERHRAAWGMWLKAGFGVTALAALLMAASPLDPHWEVIKSNYVPVLNNKTFLMSLGLLVSGLLVTMLPPVLTHLSAARLRALSLQEYGWLTAALVVLLALLGFAMSAAHLPEGLGLFDHYEMLFWAGGHILQFAFTLIVMVAWLALLEAMSVALPSRRWVLMAYLLALLGAAASFAGFAIHAPETGEFTYYQTRIMIEIGGLGASLLAFLVVGRLSAEKLPCNAYTSTLIMSLLLFFAGGALGLMIQGQNVTIPAHYHGMIVGITLALMGLAYSVLPRFGYQPVATTRMAFLQPIVYGVGQLMHIGGLAYCGGYGILRKTAGGFENLSPDIKVALGIFGLGGLLAIIGGVLFVVVMLRLKRVSSV